MTKSGPLSALILGATSDIARPLARLFAADGYDLVLAGRHPAVLEGDARDLSLRHGVEVKTARFDVEAWTDHQQFIAGFEKLPDIVVSLVGLMTSQGAAERDPMLASRMMAANYSGLVTVLGELANRMEQRGSGVIVGVSSVAGDRGRAANYIYGSAKAGFTAFLSGLRNRLWRSGVTVITIKPGFVSTRMTEGMALPRILTATPQELANIIHRAVRRRRSVVYHRPIWRPIMLLIRLLPEFVFVRMKIR